jgi:hypothetical protein
VYFEREKQHKASMKIYNCKIIMHFFAAAGIARNSFVPSVTLRVGIIFQIWNNLSTKWNIIPEKKLFQTGLIIKLALADIHERMYVAFAINELILGRVCATFN